jgi:hypothetical protein
MTASGRFPDAGTVPAMCSDFLFMDTPPLFRRQKFFRTELFTDVPAAGSIFQSPFWRQRTLCTNAADAYLVVQGIDASLFSLSLSLLQRPLPCFILTL